MTDHDQPIRHRYADLITCPYCGHRHRGSWEVNDGEEGWFGERECGECGKLFTGQRHVSVTYSTEIPK